MTDTPQLYTQSGRLGSGLVVVPVVGAVSALVLGIAYSYISVYSPIAGWISLLFMAGFAVCLGAAVAKAGVVAKVRSAPFMKLAGITTGLLGLYVSWAAFEVALLGRSGMEDAPGLLDVLSSPVGVWEVALLINETGWYSIKGATPKGGVLWVLWGIEAVVVVGGVFLMAPHAVEGEVFCERCDRWCELRPLAGVLGLPENGEHLRRVAEGSVAALEGLPVVSTDQPDHLRLGVQACTLCRHGAYQVLLVQHSLDDKGNLQTSAEGVSAQHVMDPTLLERLTALTQRPIEEREETEEAA